MNRTDDRGATAAIRLVLADDHPITREPLRAYLETAGGFEVLAEAEDGAEAVRLVEDLRPDVLLLDVAMPEMDGLEVAERLTAAVPKTRILVLSGYDGPGHVRAAARMGAAGYVAKTAPLDELARAIRAVHAGRTCFPAHVGAAERGTAPHAPPTPREVQVLRLVDRGLRNSQIAAELSVSETTVQFHLRQLFVKLRAASRTEAAHRARELGWIA